ncbi:MAG: EAL domain-containing protein [Qipengyuania sp.]
MEGEEDANVPVVPISSDDVKRRVELLDSYESAGLGWFWATDSHGRIIYISESAFGRYGWSPETIIGKRFTELFLPDRAHEPEKEEKPLAFLLSARNSISQLTVRVAASDEEIWWELAGKPQFDENQRFTGYRGSGKDVTSSREKQMSAERLARYDSLTGLSNRHRMEQRLDTTLKAYRNSKRACALMMLDLDRFKQVNDTLGHPAGDELLKQVAARLQTIVGNKGEIGRLGGDEFQIMLPDMDDRGALGELGQRLIQMISQPYSVNGSRAIIGTSLGVAIAPYDGLDTEELVKAADLALYAAKGGGRGQYRFYSSDLMDGARHRRQLEEDLRDALHNEELAMHYQPLINAKTHKVTGFEALMRWEHPERGNIPPGQFIPVAEDINMIKDLGNWALKEVCRQAVEWPIELNVAVNVSAVQFAHDDFPQEVQNALTYSGIDPKRLELEITESVFLGDTGRAQRIFEEIKKLGVKLALDDFGTGYSSLSYLRTAPFDKIKIDQSFVRGATESGNNNAAIMSAIVGLAEALEMQTVAEGVETLDELGLVKERGASLIQGYIFSPAMPQADILERLASGKLEYEPRGPAKYRADRKTVFRRIGVIHEDYRYKAVMRNLSKTGARIEGLAEVPVGTQLVLDLGGGQLAVATVRRSRDIMQGVEFETPLISDGSDGLCTRHRVSPYELEAAGRPLSALPRDPYSILAEDNAGCWTSRKQFLEVDVGPPRAIKGSGG